MRKDTVCHRHLPHAAPPASATLSPAQALLIAFIGKLMAGLLTKLMELIANHGVAGVKSSLTLRRVE